MSEHSLDALVQRMQGKSVTHGWDAVVSMNRAKVNQLLEQQYIQQFNLNSFLKRLHALVPLDPDGHYGLDITGLLLSKPLLSFENASLNDSRARLSMNVVSGMIGRKLLRAPQRIVSSFAVTEAHGFSVVMDIDLEAVIGSVDKHGEVILDLSNAYDFSCDIVEAPLEQLALGRFFGDLFSRLPASSRVYRLGMLDFDPDDKLAPRNFEVRTQAAPGGRDKHSDNYREGAVVLFVRTRSSNHDGITPGDESGFPYLIPDDRDATSGKPLFSGSLVLASRVVFDQFIHAYVVGHVGRGLILERISDSDLIARGYQARAGGWVIDNMNPWEPGAGENWSMRNNEPLDFKFASDESGAAPMSLTVAAGGVLKLVWRSVNTFSFKFHRQVARADYSENADVRFTHELEFVLKAEVDPQTSVVTFVAAEGSSRSCTSQKMGGDMEYRPFLRGECEARVNAMLDLLHQQLLRIEMVELDLFALNHLLFPEQNALLLTHGVLPGDLALFGHIDPRHTAFSVEPTFVNVEAAAKQSFETLSTRIDSGAAAVTWSVRGIDASVSAGTIDQNGLFTAPPRSQMQGQAVRCVVTASQPDPDTGETLSASALVVVVGEGTVVMPSMVTLDLRLPEPVELRASALDDGVLNWRLVSGPGSLQGNGERATYTPPDDVDEVMDSALIEVLNSKSGGRAFATVLLSKTIFGLNVIPSFHPGVPPKGAVQIRVQSADVPAEDVQWSVSAGEGTVNPATGEFTAPDRINMPYSVVQAAYSDGFYTQRGFSVVFQSEYASEARWQQLQVFELKADSSLNLFANGQQQVSVRIEVEPMDVDGQPVAVSDSELNSIQLVDAVTREPLAQVDAQGVPEGQKIWASNVARNSFELHPGSRASEPPDPRLPRVRNLYVQTRADTSLKIAASLVRDDLVTFYSVEDNDSGDQTIEPKPIKPPTFSDDNYSFEATRVSGGPDDDYDMETVDFYILKLSHNGELLRFREIAFEQRSGTVQWESRQYQEDVASFTGYALHGDTELRFDSALHDYLVAADVEIDPEIMPGQGCPEGTLLISLHRIQYWLFDLMCEQTYAQPVIVKVLDEYGNQHRLSIHFASPMDRHKLVVQAL